MVIEPMKYGLMKPGLMVIHSIGCPQPDPKYGLMKSGLMVIGFMRIGHLCETQFKLSEAYYNKIRIFIV